MKKIRGWLSLCALIFLLSTWQTNAVAKPSKNSSKTGSSTVERKNPHGSQGTGNWKGKRDKHEKPGPQNEKKKKSSKWFPLKK